MKKLMALFLLSSLAICTTSADEYIIFVGEAFTYNSVYRTLVKTEYAIKYDDEDEVFYLYTVNFMTTGWIHLSLENLDVLRYAVNKYLEWEKTAIEKQVTIEKDIPDASFQTEVNWTYGDDWYSSKRLTLVFRFFSQNITTHQFVIISSKTESISNRFIDYKLETLYFNHDQAIALLTGISDESIEKAKEEQRKKKEAEELFN